MAKAVEYMKNGDRVLIAIGAAHILGPDGLARQLAQAGYYAERVEE